MRTYLAVVQDDCPAVAPLAGVLSVEVRLIRPRDLSVSHPELDDPLGAGLAPEVSHFASKAVIEQHLRSSGLRHTILQPAAFMENLLMPVVRKGIAKGKLTTPHALDAPQQLIAVDDIGAVAAKVMLTPEAYAGRTIPLVGDAASTRGMASTLSRVLGREIKAGQLPGVLVMLFLGRDLHRMFRWLDQHGGKLPHPTEDLRAPLPSLRTFEQWCRHAFASV